MQTNIGYRATGRKACGCIALAALMAAFAALGDDMVCVSRIDAGTNDVTMVAELPFSPLGSALPIDYLSGNFMGNGGPGSDRLHVRSAATGFMTNAVFASGMWLDPATRAPTTMTAELGDALYLVRSDADPLSFYLYGRSPVTDANPPFSTYVSSDLPRFTGATVNPYTSIIELSVETAAKCDIFSVDCFGDEIPSIGWRHVLRRRDEFGSFVFRDQLPAAPASRAYLVADAERNSDDDCLPDALETLVYGTSPDNYDTDGDGVYDDDELAWGDNPLVPDQPERPYCYKDFFSESFDRWSGAIDGHDGWTALRSFHGLSRKTAKIPPHLMAPVRRHRRGARRADGEDAAAVQPAADDLLPVRDAR